MDDWFGPQPKPPYYAAIFVSRRTSADDGYSETEQRMMELVKAQPGFLGACSLREENGLGVTMSYFKDEKSIRDWKNDTEHLRAQQLGKERWYERFEIKIVRVERAYVWEEERQEKAWGSQSNEP